MVLLIPAAVKKLKEQGRQQGRVEGRQEERAEWDAWLRRRNEAEANNRPFDEPPPSQRQ
jgi:predicted transposase YdaD